ncbi:response regulator transcription factor [Paenibacillus sp. strain BS8-2]
MFNVMIVDDDVPVVEYLRKLVPWQALGLAVSAEAYSVAEAVEQFEASPPDILLTDIGLPDGNGVELARQFRESHPRLRVVFLTCHEDFHYVQEALRIEADDYVVKDELTPEKIATSLRKASMRISSEQERWERISYKREMDRNRDVLLQQLFNDLSNGSDPAVLLESAKRLGIDWSVPCFGAALCHLDLGDLSEVYDRENVELVHYAAYNIASELATESRLTVFRSKDQRLWVISGEATGNVVTGVLSEFITRLQQKLLEFLKVRAYCEAVEETCVFSQLPGLIMRSKKTFDLTYNLGRGTSNIAPKPNVGAEVSENDTNLDMLSTKWIEALTQQDDSSAHIYLGNLEKAMRDSALHADKKKEWLLRCVQEIGVRLGRPVDAGIQGDIARTARLEEAFRIVRWYAERLVTRVKSDARETAASDPDLRAINVFIHEHIHRNITSIDIARHLHLNPSYFSRYFKKLTGTIFTDHVHLMKMEEAKRLLAKGETAENTAYMLGYSDRAYFSKVFKKYTGISPSECKLRSPKGEERE